MNTKVTALVLAAGKGTRMKSGKAKVLHEIFFSPMVHHVLEAVFPLKLTDIIVITGHQKEAVEEALQGYKVRFVQQNEQLGTGHAVKCTAPYFEGKEVTVLILCGDTPLMRTETLSKMLQNHCAKNAELTVMTTMLDDPTNYGRAVVDSDGFLLRIVEEKDAADTERDIKEINAGIYCVASKLLFALLNQVGTENKQGEMYLTDIVEEANKHGSKVNRYVCPDAREVLGVNSRVELAEAHRELQKRRNRELMLSGVTILHPESTFIEKSVIIGSDSIIHPNTHISGQTRIGEQCIIGPNVMLHDCHVADNATVSAFQALQGAVIEAGNRFGSSV